MSTFAVIATVRRKSESLEPDFAAANAYDNAAVAGAALRVPDKRVCAIHCVIDASEKYEYFDLPVPHHLAQQFQVGQKIRLSVDLL